LDISSPFVTAAGNVKVKAKAVQKKLLDDKGVDIVVIIYTAKGLSFKVPGKKLLLLIAVNDFSALIHLPIFQERSGTMIVSESQPLVLFLTSSTQSMDW
jgi:hypothetical protein